MSEGKLNREANSKAPRWKFVGLGSFFSLRSAALVSVLEELSHGVVHHIHIICYLANIHFS